MKCRCSNCGWLEVNPSGAMFCGYSDERTWEDESCMAWKDKDEPRTNADYIRAMSDEELAKIMVWDCPPNYPKGKCHEYEKWDGNLDCKQCWLDWLKQGME